MSTVYDHKVNLAMNGREYTVYFSDVDGSDAPCHYCGKEGNELIVRIEGVDDERDQLSKKSSRYKKVVEVVHQETLHKRPLCNPRSPLCEGKLIGERFRSKILTW